MQLGLLEHTAEYKAASCGKQSGAAGSARSAARCCAVRTVLVAP